MQYIHCLNNISKFGTDLLTDAYELTEDASQASGILVRSAAMHDMAVLREPCGPSRAPVQA